MKITFSEPINVFLGLVGAYMSRAFWMYFIDQMEWADAYFVFMGKNASFLTLMIGCFLFFPYEFRGNIYSLWGGLNPNGDVHSLIELHASGRNVRSLVTLSFFSSAKKSKDSFLGVNFFSRADELFLFIGLNCFSRTEKSFVMFGANLFSF